MGTDTRDRILDVAARLFEEQGFEGTAVAAILRAAGVNSGSLYHFFPGKEALLVGVLERYVDSLQEAVIQPAEAATNDPIERVFALMDVYRGRLVVSDFARGCPVGSLAVETAFGRPRVQGLIDQYFSGWARGIRGWLEAAGDRLPDHVDRDALSRFVLTTMEGAVMQARAAGSIRPFDTAVGQLREHLELLEERAGHGMAQPPEAPEELRRPASPPESKEVETVPAAGDAEERAQDEMAEAGDQTEWRAW
jgi:AcrR family transcriptional regulator